MVFYFSGTGNSLWTAKQIGTAFNEPLLSIADELRKPDQTLTYKLREKERVFFVFPVHSWGPAVLVLRFIGRLVLDNYTGQEVYSICVCGDMCGYTDRIMRKALAQKGIRQTKAYSIQMPNNYILMKGFGVDDKETENRKLEAAPQSIGEIVENIRTRLGQAHYVTGAKPFLKSRIVYPLFRKFALKNNAFYATDACIHCGLCAKVCPTGTISLRGGRPVWKSGTCVQCTACIHRCPVQAIEYGKASQGQGRYYNPQIALKSPKGDLPG